MLINIIVKAFSNSLHNLQKKGALKVNTILITPQPNNNYTLIPNWFIDHYMASSNGDFIKVYLLLLRCISNNINEFSTSSFADLLHLTESDIVRALKFWESKGIIILVEENNKITSISFANSSSPAIEEQAISIEPKEEKTVYLNLSSKPQYTMDELSSFMTSAKYKDLIYVTGRYLGRNLTQNDLSTLISFHDWLGLPIEVIEWLIEYCVSNNHTKMRYIEAVAIEWADNNINSLEKARLHTEVYNKKYYQITRALGIGTRSPVPFEIKIMNKWLFEYNFDLEIILEACTRTMRLAPNGGFKYTDSILTNWFENNVGTIKDIEKLDQQHVSKNIAINSFVTPINSKNKFINFEQREYDFDKIEKKAMEMVLKDNTEGGYK